MWHHKELPDHSDAVQNGKATSEMRPLRGMFVASSQVRAEAVTGQI